MLAALEFQSVWSVAGPVAGIVFGWALRSWSDERTYRRRQSEKAAERLLTTLLEVERSVRENQTDDGAVSFWPAYDAWQDVRLANEGAIKGKKLRRLLHAFDYLLLVSGQRGFSLEQPGRVRTFKACASMRRALEAHIAGKRIPKDLDIPDWEQVDEWIIAEPGARIENFRGKR